MSLTRLQAVNRMLSAVGESIVLVEVDGAGDFANCSDLIDQVTLDVLAKGWEFNTRSRTYTPDTDGIIAIPSDVLKIDPVDKRNNYVLVGGKLIDKVNDTEVFTAPVKCSVTLAYAFEQCPFHIQQQIAATATKKYQRRYAGSSTADNFLREEEGIAVADTAASEEAVDNFNMLEDNPDLDWVRRRTWTNHSI